MQAEQPQRKDPEATLVGESDEVTHIVPPESEWPPASADAGVYDPDEAADEEEDEEDEEDDGV